MSLARLTALLLLGGLVLPAAAQEVLFLPPPEPMLTEPLPADEPPVLVTEEVASPDIAVADIDVTIPEAPVAHWYYPSQWFGPTPWDTGFEMGLNGSSGTSDTLSTRVGGYIKRKSEATKLDASLYHNRTKSDGEETQSNALLDLRNDWLMTGSPWSVYVMNQTFYDEFQSFDLNVNVNSGVGYQVFDTDFVKFGTSLGAGAARKFGGRRDEWVPEAQAGVKWEQNVSDTQKFYAKLDYFPEWEDFNNYRMMTDVGWEIELSRPSNVSLKLSLTDRFDSQPDGVNPHNTNYSVLLLWKK